MSMTFKADVSGTFGTIQINGVDQIVIDNNGDVKSPAGLVMASGAGIVGDADLGAIIESGSNANGRYIKYQDGTLICHGPDTVSFATTLAVGSLYYQGSLRVDWAMPFIETPEGFLGTRDAVASGAWPTCIGCADTHIQSTIYSPSASCTGLLIAMAIGRWK